MVVALFRGFSREGIMRITMWKMVWAVLVAGLLGVSFVGTARAWQAPAAQVRPVKPAVQPAVQPAVRPLPFRMAGSPVPQLIELKAGDDGKVRIEAMRTEKRKVNVGAAGGNPNQIREITMNRWLPVELSEVKDLAISTADGKKVNLADALKKLAKGGVVLVSGDGKPVDPKYLKLFRKDVLVLASPELIGSGRFQRGGRLIAPPIRIQPRAIQRRAIPAQVPPAKKG
jgi:hypothetical protein